MRRALLALLLLVGCSGARVTPSQPAARTRPALGIVRERDREQVRPERASRGGQRQPVGSRRTPGDRIPAHGGSSTLLRVTAYCSTGHRAASGVWPQVGQAAGNRWPFGTRLNVPGYGMVTVTDRIGWGADVDLFMGSGADCEHRARQWGLRHLAVTEIRKG